MSDEPITTEELLALARIVPGDEELGLVPGYISAARQQVERDTDLLLVSAVYSILTQYLPGGSFAVPFPPLVAVQSIGWRDAAGELHAVPPSHYLVDTSGIPGRVYWTPPAGWAPTEVPTAWVVSFNAGYTPETIPPALKWAVGLLAAHYLTTARDMVVTGTIATSIPYGYQEAVDRFRVVTVI